MIYTGLGLDRAQPIRRDPARLAALFQHPGLRGVPLWRGLNLLAGDLSAAVLAGGADAKRLLAAGREPIFLGLAEGEQPVFAVDLSVIEAEKPGPDLGLGGRFVALRTHGPLLPLDQGALLAYALGMIEWQSRQRFCGTCGAPTAAEEGGHVYRCSGATCGRQSYPRTDPVVIMLVEDGDRVLLHRQPGWAPGMWSVLAGFVEPGETLEEAVAREVMEETAIAVADVRYAASQPWPFPSSLMVGFTARAVGGELTPDFHELEDARWFSRQDLAAFDDRYREAADGPYLARKGTIARCLLDEWIGGK